MLQFVLPLAILTSLAISSYGHLGLTKTECDALYNQFPNRGDMHNSYQYSQHGVGVTVVFSNEKAVVITYHLEGGFSDKQIEILLAKNDLSWSDFIPVPSGDSWMRNNKLKTKQPISTELYNPSEKGTHVTVSERNQWVNIVTQDGENMLFDYFDKLAKEQLKDF